MYILSLSLSGNNKLTNDNNCELVHVNNILLVFMIFPVSCCIHVQTLYIRLSYIMFILSINYTDRSHVIDIIPHLWMLDGQLVTGNYN